MTVSPCVTSNPAVGRAALSENALNENFGVGLAKGSSHTHRRTRRQYAA
jgi:hypothetical protein